MKRNSTQTLISTTFKVVALLVPAVLLANVSVVWLAEPTVQFCYGDAFLATVPALIALLPGLAAMSLNVILMNFFASAGMPLFTVVSTGFASLVNVLANLYLIPLYGIVGASVASSLSYAIMLCASCIYLACSKGVD